mgnify:CR=1 FL=1
MKMYRVVPQTKRGNDGSRVKAECITDFNMFISVQPGVDMFTVLCYKPYVTCIVPSECKK